MRIVADENIPLVEEGLRDLGEVVRLPGRAIARENLKEADALLVRSVTRVGPELLEGTPIRFVGTATIGLDHIDAAWLGRNDIAFAHAPGSNAGAVGQWVVAALVELEPAERARPDALPWAGQTLGVVGCGAIGGRLLGVGRALGMEVLACDPPLEREGWRPPEGTEAATFDEILGRADVITLHVPLTKEGQDATVGMIGEEALDLLGRRKGGAPPILLNAARGGLVETPAALRALEEGLLSAIAFDVFEGEPSPDRDLISQAALTTPHIAGYSLEGKRNGAIAIIGALRRHLGAAAWTPPPLPEPDNARVDLDGLAGEGDRLRAAVRASYNIRADSAALKSAAEKAESPADFAAAFDRLRRDYAHRREFEAMAIVGSPGPKEALSALGFRIAN